MEFGATNTMRLNSQAQKFDGCATGKRVFGRTPKMTIGTVRGLHFDDSMNPMEPQTTKTHHLLGVIRKIRQASVTEDFNGKIEFASK